MAALTDIIARSAWMPISTAPKDGTDILAYQKWEDGPERILVMRWDEKGGWRTNVHSFVRFDPTHWQPLPSPPA